MAPYAPAVWQLGGLPSVEVDVPVTAVYLALYITGAITHMTIFQRNRIRDHRFKFSLILFGFCMARTVTCILRIASISLPEDVPLSIAAAIFVAAGVVLIYIVNMIFAQRIIRAQHPSTGWHPMFRVFYVAIYAVIILTLIILITSVVQSYYTLSANTHRIDRAIQLYGATTYAIIAFLPNLLLVASLLLPRNHPQAVDKFGTGHFRTKLALLFLTSSIICAGAAWRAGSSWVDQVPMSQPVPWYFQKVYFYIFNFTVEVLVVFIYAIARIDHRFHIPDGARGAGSYAAGSAGPEDQRSTRIHEGGSQTNTKSDFSSEEKGIETNIASPASHLHPQATTLDSVAGQYPIGGLECEHGTWSDASTADVEKDHGKESFDE